MKYKKWILFRITTGIVHWMWNGEYPVLITPDEDLDEVPGFYAWENFHKDPPFAAWEEFFRELENSRKQTFKFNGYSFTIVARGNFQEP